MTARCAAASLLVASLLAGCIQIRLGPEPGPPPDAPRATPHVPAERPSRTTLARALAAAAPRSILVVPAGNWSSHGHAADLLLSTVPPPLARKGYYVFPVHTVRTALAQQGLDSTRLGTLPPEQLAARFGADAVLYMTVVIWDTDYAVTHTVLTIEADYRLVGKSGELLWSTRQRVQHRPEPWEGHKTSDRLVRFIEKSVTAAIARAAPDYLTLARKLNEQAFVTGEDALSDTSFVTSR